MQLQVKPMIALGERSEAQIWQKYRAELLRFVLTRLGNRPLAEDIVHEVFLKAHAHRKELRDHGKLRPWLYQITRNALADHYRSQKPVEPLPEDLLSDKPREDDHAEQDLARCLLPLLEALPVRYQHALKLVELEGATQQELASREGLALSGAKSRVQRGRKMLREVLLRCCRVEMDQRGGVADYEPASGCDCDCY